jgi:hypothetical protein
VQGYEFNLIPQKEKRKMEEKERKRTFFLKSTCSDLSFLNFLGAGGAAKE